MEFICILYVRYCVTLTKGWPKSSFFMNPVVIVRNLIYCILSRFSDKIVSVLSCPRKLEIFPNDFPDLKYSRQDSLKIAAVSRVFNCIWFPLSFALPLGLSFLLLRWLNHRSVESCQHIMMAGNVTRAFWRKMWKYFCIKKCAI